MRREPDWESLNQINFIIARRVGDSLNAALNALRLAEMPESKLDPQIWRDRAKAAIANVLNLHQAWGALYQFKTGMQLPPNSIRPFQVQALLDWMTVQMELMPPPQAKQDITIIGNQASIQEALLLLYSVGATQGTSVHLNLELTDNGGWFRVRFIRPSPMPNTLNEVIKSFGESWRSQDAAFELQIAGYFIEMNGGKIAVNWDKDQKLGEFSFFVYKAGADQRKAPDITTSPDVEHAKIVANLSRAALSVAAVSPNDDTVIAQEGQDNAKKKAESSEAAPSEKMLIATSVDQDTNKLRGAPANGTHKNGDKAPQKPKNLPEATPRIIAVALPEIEKPALLATQPMKPVDTEKEATP